MTIKLLQSYPPPDMAQLLDFARTVAEPGFFASVAPEDDEDGEPEEGAEEEATPRTSGGEPFPPQVARKLENKESKGFFDNLLS